MSVRKFALSLVVLLSSLASADIEMREWNLHSATLTYEVKYVLKTVQGVSRAAKGKGRCSADSCEFLVAAPVKSFDSGDTNRDFHMLEVTKGALHPMVSVRLKLARKTDVQKFLAPLEIEFAGQKHTYLEVMFTANKTTDGYQIKGTVPLKLSDFSVERPALLGVSIDDAVPVTVDVRWQ